MCEEKKRRPQLAWRSLQEQVGMFFVWGKVTGRGLRRQRHEQAADIRQEANV